MPTKRNKMNNISDIPVAESGAVIEKRLGFMIRRYLSKPTKSLAQKVVKQLEDLLRHPDCIGYPDDRCGYKKMLQQWRAMT